MRVGLSISDYVMKGQPILCINKVKAKSASSFIRLPCVWH